LADFFRQKRLKASVFNKGIEVIAKAGLMIAAVQLVPLIGSIIPTEAALKRTFDKNGIRIIQKPQ